MPSEKLPDLLSAEIMLRDHATCVFCGATKATGAKLSVDHLLARSWGGTNAHTNLVVACKECNDAKGNMDDIAFADMIDRYRATLPALVRFGAAPGAELLDRVQAAITRSIDPQGALAALALIKASRRKALPQRGHRLPRLSPSGRSGRPSASLPATLEGLSMTKPMPAAEFVAAPSDLADVLLSVGLRATLAVERIDGAPLTAEDRQTLPVVLEGYALGRELQPTDDELADAVVALGQQAPLATGGA